MKKIVPIVLAIFAFAVALVMNQPEPQVKLIVAAVDLPEGRILTSSDLTTRAMPKSLAPDGAIPVVEAVLGQRLRIPRSAGDPILASHLGGETLALQASERAIALSVSAAQGLAGLLKPGDRVGVTVIVNNGQHTFAKYLAGGLRILWLDPAFRRDPAPLPTPQPASDSASMGGAFSAPPVAVSADSGAAAKGLIVLAVPISAQSLIYDFSLAGADSKVRPLYLIDLLPALSAQGAQFGLVLEPERADEAYTSGIILQEIAVTPGPTHTPTAVTSPTEVPSPTPQW